MENKINKINKIHDYLKDVYLEKITYEAASLNIFFTNTTTKPDIEVNFEWVRSSRINDSSFLLRMDNEYESLLFGAYVTQDADLLNWFHYQSFNIYEKENLSLYIFVVEDEQIEVISSKEPSFIFHNKV